MYLGKDSILESKDTQQSEQEDKQVDKQYLLGVNSAYKMKRNPLITELEKENLLGLAADWELLTQVYITMGHVEYDVESVRTLILDMGLCACKLEDFLKIYPDLQGWGFFMSTLQLLGLYEDEVQTYLSFSGCGDSAINLGAWARGYCEGRGWLPKYKEDPYGFVDYGSITDHCRELESRFPEELLEEDDPLYMLGCQESSAYED